MKILATKYEILNRIACVGDKFSNLFFIAATSLRQGLATSRKSGKRVTEVVQWGHSVASNRNGLLHAGQSAVKTLFFPPQSLCQRFFKWCFTKSTGPAARLHFGHFECFIENTSLHRLFKHLIFTIGVSSAFFGAGAQSLGRFSQTACPSIEYCPGIFCF